MLSRLPAPAVQVPQVAQLAREAVDQNYAVVIGLQSTGEVRILLDCRPAVLPEPQQHAQTSCCIQRASAAEFCLRSHSCAAALPNLGGQVCSAALHQACYISATIAVCAIAVGCQVWICEGATCPAT